MNKNTAMDVNQHLEKLNELADNLDYGRNPVELYEPISYIMNLGGKRLRPLLTVLGYSLFKEEVGSSYYPAMAIEVFHNFTLVHDDIMDCAPLRRGKETVHTKWDENRAILSGDVMLIHAYEMLLNAPNGNTATILKRFSTTAREVCEGQQMDMNFEDRDDVTVDEYLEMIRLKTAVLLGFALELGGLLVDTSAENAVSLYQFGMNIGVGFQLKDDLLDVYGDQAKFGKQVGGDIISNKKTFLLINALEKAKGAEKESLDYWLSKDNLTEAETTLKVQEVTQIYDALGIKELTEAKMEEHFNLGFQHLEAVVGNADRKEQLRQFSYNLIHRDR